MVCRQTNILPVFLLLVPSCFAQTAFEHLRRVADTYKGLKSLQVEADVERGLADQRRKIKLVIALYIRPPNRVRIETKDDGNILRSVLIWNGTSIIEYTVLSREYFSTAGTLSVTFNPDRGTGLGEMVYDTIDDGVSNASIRGQQTLVIGRDRIPCAIVDVEYGPQKRPAQFSFWIAKTGLVFRRAVTFWDGKETHTLVSSVRALTTNEHVPEETFEFQPPPGVKKVPPPPTGPAVLAAR